MKKQMSYNFMSVVNPDYKIEIGIKDKKVVSLNWSEMIKAEMPKNNEEVFKLVETFLKKALLYHKEIRQT